MYTRLSALYFLYYVASGFYMPFVSLFYKNLGFSGGQIGLLAALAPLVGMVMGPFWGYVADTRGQRIVLLRLALVGGILTAPLLLLPRTFVPVAVLIALLTLCLSSVLPLTDTTTLEWVKHAGGTTYGQIRLWGSAGYIGGGLVAGQILGLTGIHVMFGFYSGLLIGPLVVAMSVRPPRLAGQVAAGVRGGVGSLLRHPRLGPFYLLVFLGYSTVSSYNVFYALYLKGMGAPAQVVGLAIAVGGLTEIPVMWYSSKLIARWGGRTVLLLAFTLYAVRWFLLAAVHTPLLAVATQMLAGADICGLLRGWDHVCRSPCASGTQGDRPDAL